MLNEEAAELYRERGNRGHLQYALDNLGWAALMRGDQQQAEVLHRESLALSRQLGDKLVAAEALEGLACSASARGEAERVARLFGAAEAQREAVGGCERGSLESGTGCGLRHPGIERYSSDGHR